MLDFCLIAIGIVLIVISYVISEKMENGKNKIQPEAVKVDIWTQKEESIIKERIHEILSEKTEEAMIKTDDQLSQICNEKIMAVSDFSDQILEKIKQNHTEVVFLYDMLNEKDAEIKKLIHETDVVKAKLESAARGIVQEVSDIPLEEKYPMIKEKPATSADIIEESKKSKKISQVKESKFLPDAKKEAPIKENPPIHTASDNTKDQILKLYEEGKSIIEIAKTLDRGQGEVKLVIDLFQGARG